MVQSAAKNHPYARPWVTIWSNFAFKNSYGIFLWSEVTTCYVKQCFSKKNLTFHVKLQNSFPDLSDHPPPSEWLSVDLTKFDTNLNWRHQGPKILTINRSNQIRASSCRAVPTWKNGKRFHWTMIPVKRMFNFFVKQSS